MYTRIDATSTQIISRLADIRASIRHRQTKGLAIGAGDQTLIKMFTVRCLVATATLTAAAARQPPLEAELAAGGLNEITHEALSSILRGVGLYSIADVQQLNAPEQLELSESLRAAGVDLGSRSRLRRLSDGAAVPTAPDSSHESFRPVGPCRGGDSLQPRRVQTKEGVAEADVKGSGGVSMDTLALMSSYIRIVYIYPK